MSSERSAFLFATFPSMFGGVHAVEDVSFDVEPGETFRDYWPEWRWQEHDLQFDQPAV